MDLEKAQQQTNKHKQLVSNSAVFIKLATISLVLIYVTKPPNDSIKVT